jgi:DNA-binding transcriptional LysR family regulator
LHYFSDAELIELSDVFQATSKSCAINWISARHQIPDMLDMAEAAKEGLGMVVLPCFFADALDGLIRIPGTGPVSSRPGWVLTHPDLRSSVRVMTFVRFLVAEMTKQEAMIVGNVE